MRTPSFTVSCIVTLATSLSGLMGCGTEPAPTTVQTAPAPLARRTFRHDTLAAGSHHTCAVAADGTVACWGDNNCGQLGDGTNVDRLTPVTVTGLSNVIAVTAGDEHTCALQAGGRVYCWGRTQEGEAPTPANTITTSTSSSGTVTAARCFDRSSYRMDLATYNPTATVVSASPTSASFSGSTTSSSIVAIAAGSRHTCGVRGRGDVVCWGENDNGQLGDGTTTNREKYVIASALTSEASAIFAGADYTCALVGDHERCWGREPPSTLPSGVYVANIHLIAVGLGANMHCWLRHDGTAFCDGSVIDYSEGDPDVTAAVGLRVGERHACVVTASGRVLCWGENDHGQLGDGTDSRRVQGTLAIGISDATEIATGAYHTCVRRVGGQVACFGYNAHGQLGDGTIDSSATAVAVTGLSTVANPDLAAGDDHACMLGSDGTVSCWGRGSSGQLGNGGTSNKTSPTPVTGLSNAIGLAAGGSSTCALESTGEVTCWGDDTYCQMGDGTCGGSRLSPSTIAMRDAKTVAVGGRHACAVTSPGWVYCWGANEYGQALMGSGGGSFVRTASALGIDDTIAIAAGGDHTCWLTAQGGVHCGGRNHHGQIGDGTTNDAVDSFAAPDGDATSIAAGNAFTCASHRDGTVSCWGANGSGQLGDGTTTERLSKVSVSGLSNVVMVVAGTAHACALKGDGTVACWGRNLNGQLGDGSTTNRSSPVAVSSVSNVVALTAGSSFTCARKADGTRTCWGGNVYGQLGNGTSTLTGGLGR
ncbi:MAG: RCC1 repeat-containing protein [Deltaproteobacteria bacterium]|nr:RCC1 repeat-containing protein [Deltaproteobacteria bacterium]